MNAISKCTAVHPAVHSGSSFLHAGITPIRFDGRRRPLATLSARLPELP